MKKTYHWTFLFAVIYLFTSCSNQATTQVSRLSIEEMYADDTIAEIIPLEVFPSPDEFVNADYIKYTNAEKTYSIIFTGIPANFEHPAETYATLFPGIPIYTEELSKNNDSYQSQDASGEEFWSTVFTLTNENVTARSQQIIEATNEKLSAINFDSSKISNFELDGMQIEEHLFTRPSNNPEDESLYAKFWYTTHKNNFYLVAMIGTESQVLGLDGDKFFHSFEVLDS